MRRTKCILVVEDDDDLAQVTAQALEANGFETVVAGNGLEAIEYLRRGSRPDLILLDMAMPVMDGWEFRSAQQKLPEAASIPVMVLTADGDARRKSVAVGAQGHLHKPVGLDTLLEAVRRLAGARSRR